MDGYSTNGNLDLFQKPFEVDGAVVTVHFSPPSEREASGERELSAIKEILLASYHAN